MSVRLASPVVPMPAEPFSAWGPRSSGFHEGVDIDTGIGEPLHALTSGTVVDTLLNAAGRSGIAVVVQDDSGRVRWSFSHCSALVVLQGERVRRSQVVAYSGNTGNVRPAPSASCPACGSHVHIRVDVDGVNVDPWPLFSRGSGARAVVGAGVFALLASRFL